MKFGETFMEYLRGDQEGFLVNCSHVEYKRLKKVLKLCRNCKAVKGCDNGVAAAASPVVVADDDEEDNGNEESRICRYQSCPMCDQLFFSELMREASDIAGCFSSKVRHLLHLHINTGMQRYLIRLRQCFKNDRQALVHEGQMLMEYVIMNAIAIRKILKKYDKIHSSVSGQNFKSKLRSEHVEILQSPWLIELVAFYLNFNDSNGGNSSDVSGPFSCDLCITEPMMTLVLPDSGKLEYNLTCAICLEMVFNPYALSCGHLFCKSCACSAASVMIFQGVKAASPETKCPVCREAGVYAKAVNLIELDLLLKKRCKEYWKERAVTERAEVVKQTKAFWDSQTKYVIGYS